MIIYYCQLFIKLMVPVSTIIIPYNYAFFISICSWQYISCSPGAICLGKSVSPECIRLTHSFNLSVFHSRFWKNSVQVCRQPWQRFKCLHNVFLYRPCSLPRNACI